MPLSTAKKLLLIGASPDHLILLENAFATLCPLLTADHAADAILLMRGDHHIFAVLLDVTVSEQDGFSFLEEIRDFKELCGIPVVVITGRDSSSAQEKALSSGATDVIRTPLQPELIRRRMENLLIMVEAVKNVRNQKKSAELTPSDGIDVKTGLLNKQTFSVEVPKIMAAHPDRSYVLARWDIDNFSLFNDTYGSEAGDRLLAKIGSRILSFSSLPSASGMLASSHWEADHFVFLWDKSQLNAEELVRFTNSHLSHLFPNFSFSARYGFYRIEETESDVNVMCDRALLALRSIKNNYNVHYTWYDISMHRAAVEEHEIVTAMHDALRHGEFLPYFQPQYNYNTGKMIGAEALVRWCSPKKGLIMPGKFIPLFEKNGFIIELDSYLWDRVCRQLRIWIDAGLQVPPISVNVSRRDLNHAKLTDLFEKLMKKYRLDPSLLRLEVTESAYMDNPEQMVRTVSYLQSLGFHIEMDDFGSGYSSLNTLKDVPVDLLKLDMKFISSDTGTGRGGSILNSIVRMAYALNLPVLAEGVETQQQADYLKSIGCFYMQGYYFAKPMPAEAFESLLVGGSGLDAEDTRFRNGIDHAVDFLNAETQSALLFNSFVGGASIIEYDGINVAALRTNDRLLEMFHLTWEQYAKVQYHLMDLFLPESRALYLQMLESAIASGKETDCESCFIIPFKTGSKTIWAYNRARFLARKPGSCLFYISVEDITNRKLLAEENESQKNELNAIINSVPGGVQIYEITKDGIRRTFSNHAFASKFDHSPVDNDARVNKDPLLSVHPEDRAKAKHYLDNFQNGIQDSAVMQLRLALEKNGWRWVMMSCSVVARTPESTLICLVIIDIEKQVLNEHINDMYGNIISNLPIGVAVCEIGKQTKTRYINDITCKMFGLTKDSLMKQPADIHPASFSTDGKPFPPDMLKKLRKGEVVVMPQVQVKRKDGSMFWLRLNLHGVQHDHEPLMLYASLIDVSAQVEDTRIKAEQAFLMEDERAKLQALYSSLPCGVMQYSAVGSEYRLIRYNDASYRLFGYNNAEEYEKALVGHSRISDIHPDDRKFVDEQIRRVEETGASAEFNHRIVCVDGSIRWVRVNLQWIDGLTPHSFLQSTFIDITDLIAAQHTVLRQQQEISAIISAVPGGIFKYYADETEQFTYLSDGLLDMLGYTRKEFLQKFQNRFSQMVYHEDRPVALGKINSDISKTGSRDTCEYRIETKSGALKWVFDAGRLMEDDQGKKQFLVVVVDIDERRKLEEDRKERLTIADSIPEALKFHPAGSTEYGLQSHLEAILSYIPSGIAIFRVIGSVAERIYLSHGGLSTLGYSANDTVNRDPDKLLLRVHPDDRQAVLSETAESIAKEKTFNMNMRLLLSDGKIRWTNLTANPVRGSDGALYFYGVYTDITEIRSSIEHSVQ